MLQERDRTKRIPDETLKQAAQVLRVLAHAPRLRIIELLLDNRMNVGELAEELDLAPHAVSQHLNHMRAHGLLDSTREGRQVFYRVVNPHAANCIQCIRQHGTGSGEVNPGGDRI
jgi:DNA-binding transcriptional ArsR family regulator